MPTINPQFSYNWLLRKWAMDVTLSSMFSAQNLFPDESAQLDFGAEAHLRVSPVTAGDA